MLSIAYYGTQTMQVKVNGTWVYRGNGSSANVWYTYAYRVFAEDVVEIIYSTLSSSDSGGVHVIV